MEKKKRKSLFKQIALCEEGYNKTPPVLVHN